MLMTNTIMLLVAIIYIDADTDTDEDKVGLISVPYSCYLTYEA